MTEREHPDIVVGIDGSEDGERALRYAVDEARRTGAPITLVHVTPDSLPPSLMYPLVVNEIHQAGHRILADAVEDAMDLYPDVTVGATVHRGRRAAGIVAAAKHARCVVLGHRHVGVLERISTGTTTTGVAARAHCPVVAVPPEWDPEATHRRVVVGFKAAAHSSELLSRAFAEAAARGARLVVLHAWRLPAAYEDIVASKVAEDDWNRSVREELDPALEPWRRSYPQVEVDVEVVHASAGQALLDAAATADVLVVQRATHGFPAAAHLGGVARTVLRSAPCPVVVVPPSAVAAEVPGLVLEEDGSLRK